MNDLQKTSKELLERFVFQTEKVFARWGYQINDEQRQQFLNTHIADAYSMTYTLWDEWDESIKGTMPGIPLAMAVLLFGSKKYKKCECSCHDGDKKIIHIVACCDRGYRPH